MIKRAIYDEAQRVLKRTQSHDPYDIMDALGIIYIPVTDFVELKGMYKSEWRRHFVFVNANIPPRVQRMVMLHEIGHHVLHREDACVFQEFELYNMVSEKELEANIFASAILLADADVYGYAREG